MTAICSYTGTDYPSAWPCPVCGAEPSEPCPYDGLTDSLLNPTTAVGGVTGATCDLEEGVCESCQ